MGLFSARRVSRHPLTMVPGGKDPLYVAVLEHVLGELRQEELKLEMEHVTPLEGVMQLFDFTYEHFGRHPELIHLLSGDNLMRAKFLKLS